MPCSQTRFTATLAAVLIGLVAPERPRAADSHGWVG